jgi:hypothetical protein
MLRELRGIGFGEMGENAVRRCGSRATRMIENYDRFTGHAQRNGHDRAEGERLDFHARILHPSRLRACALG